MSALRRPDVRRSLLACLDAFGELDGAEDLGQIVAYDNVTFELEWLWFGGGASRMVGETLHNATEARALDGLRAAFDLLYDALGGSAPHDEAVRHPGFLAVVCCAAFAAEALRRNDASTLGGAGEFADDVDLDTEGVGVGEEAGEAHAPRAALQAGDGGGGDGHTLGDVGLAQALRLAQAAQTDHDLEGGPAVGDLGLGLRAVGSDVVEHVGFIRGDVHGVSRILRRAVSSIRCGVSWLSFL